MRSPAHTLLRWSYVALLMVIWLAGAELLNRASTLGNALGLSLLAAYALLGYRLFLAEPLRDWRHRRRLRQSEAYEQLIRAHDEQLQLPEAPASVRRNPKQGDP